MRIFGKEINNENEYNKQNNKFLKLNKISSFALSIIGLLIIISHIRIFTLLGMKFFENYSFLTIFLFPLCTLLLLSSSISLKKGEDDLKQNTSNFLILIFSGTIFIYSFLAFLGFIALSDVFFLIFQENMGLIITLFFTFLLLTLSGLSAFSSFAWLLVFHLDWKQYCEKVKTSKIIRELKIKKKNSENIKQIEIKSQKELLKQLNFKKKKLQELKELFEENLISKNEYEKIRENILKGKNDKILFKSNRSKQRYKPKSRLY